MYWTKCDVRKVGASQEEQAETAGKLVLLQSGSPRRGSTRSHVENLGSTSQAPSGVRYQSDQV
jgi:hypothetical protein